LVSIGGRGSQEPGGHPKIEEKYQKKQEAKDYQDNIAVGQAPDEIVEVAQGLKPPHIHHEVHEDYGEDDIEQRETNYSQEQNFEPTPETGHHVSFLSATGVENKTRHVVRIFSLPSTGFSVMPAKAGFRF
jgi:hypothetical protein